MPSSKRNVIVTGFGPFGSHAVNASTVAVQKLYQDGGLKKDGLDLVVVEMPVEYRVVKDMIPRLWKQHDPLLVVHVGVSGIATELTLEQQAHNDGYVTKDIQGCCPAGECCVDERDKSCVLVSGIDMERVCRRVNSAGIPARACVSHDPGRYLCDFIYFSSLHMNHSNVAFIHVPPLDMPYTAAQLAEGLRVAIGDMIEQVLES